MHSVSGAMLWEMIRRGRWQIPGWFLFGNAFPFLLYAALSHFQADFADPSFVILHVILLQLSMLMFGLGIVAAQGSLSRLFLLPVSTARIVVWHLLPGGLIRNAHQQFIRRDQRLVVENADTAWTHEFTNGEEIVIPLKNADGGYIASDETLARIQGEGLVAFRYAGVNPNGSVDDIAGLTNERGNVVGLMPHPEHAIEPGFGPDTAAAMRSGVDGLKFVTAAVSAVVGSAA